MFRRMLMLLVPLLALPVFGQLVPKDPEATVWEQVGKNRWKAFIPGKNYSRVDMVLVDSTVTFRVTQKCPVGNKVEETTLEWSAGDTVGKGKDCEGRATKHDGMPKLLEEKVFKPYPPEVAKVLSPKLKIKIPPRPSIENMHMAEPLHEARRASAPGFFYI